MRIWSAGRSQEPGQETGAASVHQTPAWWQSQEERSTLNLAANNPWGVESSAVINIYWFLTWKLVESAKWLWLLITINHLLTFYHNLKVSAISKSLKFCTCFILINFPGFVSDMDFYQSYKPSIICFLFMFHKPLLLVIYLIWQWKCRSSTVQSCNICNKNKHFVKKNQFHIESILLLTTSGRKFILWAIWANGKRKTISICLVVLFIWTKLVKWGPRLQPVNPSQGRQDRLLARKSLYVAIRSGNIVKPSPPSTRLRSPGGWAQQLPVGGLPINPTRLTVK